MPETRDRPKSYSIVSYNIISPSMRSLLPCICISLLSATGSSVTGEDSASSTSDDRFLRRGTSDSVITAASVDEEYFVEEEEFDYETYHNMHHIPVPALGATMMGLMNQDSLSNMSGGGPDAVVDEEIIQPRRSILAFAGTSEAMKSFAGGLLTNSDRDDDNLLFDMTPKDISGNIEDNIMHNNAMATLDQITKYRSTLLYGSDPSPDMIVTDSIKNLSRNAKTKKQNKQSIASLKYSKPRLPKNDNDLDRGRHLVGLEVREVQPHQRVIIDYQQNTNTNDYEEQQILRRPIRIKYVLADSSTFDLNTEMLSTLIDSSFNRTSTLWTRVLSLSPVVGNIIPTVATCGSARIPEQHREEGVDDADIVIYVTSDNKFCAGSIMHSAICDFDQNMRPLVANINVCTNNIPTTIAPEYGVPMYNFDDYEGYITTETARILGASISLLRHYKNPDTGVPYGASMKNVKCVDGTQEIISLPNTISEEIDYNAGQVYYISTPNVIEVVRNHFDCMTMTGARLEGTIGTTSCFGAFLDENLFFSEMLTSFQITRATSISPLTLALLEDSSWYVANYTLSSDTSFGRGAGCQFVHGGSCEINNDYCNEVGKLGCDVTHSFKARCDALVGEVSPFRLGDVCPIYVRDAVDCTHVIPDESMIPGEYFGESSKCFLTVGGDPICLQGICNKEKQGIDINHDGEIFTCTRDGEIIDTTKGLRIVCPRISSVCPDIICPSNCSARGVCDEDRDGKHSCICDDPFDDSPGCWGMMM